MEKHEKETWAAEAAADAPKSRQSRAFLRAAAEKALALLFWILIWALAAKILNKPLLVSTPWETFRTILRMLSEADFWSATLQTFLRMLGGFGIAIFSAFVLSVLSAKLRPVRILAETPRAFMAGVPLAAFVILALFWVGPERLSFVISALVAFPILYSAFLTGMMQDVSKLSLAGDMYRYGLLDRRRHIRWPALWPFLLSSAGVAMRMCWRSTVAAELITQVTHSVGGELYQAKIYLETAELFSWMVLLILFGNISEWILKGFLALFEPGVFLGSSIQKGAAGAGRGKDIQKGGSEPIQSIPENKTEPIQGIPNNKPEPFGGKMPRIELEQLRPFYRDKAGTSFVFPEGGVSLSAEGGERIAVMGPSGAGKTTLLNVIAGQGEYGGSRAVNGTCFMNFSEDRLAEHLSGRKNLLMCGFSEAETDGMLSALGLTKEDGARAVREYSKGMKRRLSLARAILGLRREDGGIMLLDEPFSGLDEKSRKLAQKEVLRELDRLGQKALLVLVTHEKEDAEELSATKVLSIFPRTATDA